MSMPISPGARLGRYEIRSQLGAGGMGEVYLAEDTKLHRKVALKILPAQLTQDKDRLRRFEQEAQAAAALNHPNIAHVYEIDESDGLHFIAMEFIDGETLREKIHRDHAELRKLLRYLQQVAEGLAKAHAAGIVHRDLKPDNVMITRDGYAKILDFGLAKLTQQTEARSNQAAPDEAPTAVLPQPLSMPGIIMGTVGYMSPEQAQGQAVDQRSDIFSFGCILYEAATGRRAFEGESTVDTLHKIIHRPAPLVRDANPSTPVDLTRVVRRCLAKDPDERYQSIKEAAIELRELRRELEGAAELETTVPPPDTFGVPPSGGQFGVPLSGGKLGGAPTSPPKGGTASTQPSSSAEYLVSGIKQHKLAAIVALLILAGLTAGVGFYLHTRSTGVTIDSIAVLPFQNKSAEADTEYLSDGLAESLIYRLSQLPNLKVSPTSTVFRYKGKEIDPVKIGQELNVTAVLSGRITQRGDNLTISAELVDVRNNKLLWGEQYDRKLSDLLATQREIAREIVDKLKLKVSGEESGLAKHYTENNEAYQLYLKGRFYYNRRTEEGMRKAIENFNQAIEKDPNFALAYAGMSDSYALLAVQEATLGGTPPKEAFPKARAAALKAVELDETLVEGHVSLAVVKHYYDHDVAGAEREFKRAFELNPNYANAHLHYAVHLVGMGRLDQAVAEVKRAQELDPLALGINSAVGWVLYFARQYDQSIEQSRKTLEMDPNFGLALFRLGLAYEQKQMYEQAIAAFQKAIALSDGGPLAIASLGHAYALSGRRSEAQKVLAELQELAKQRYVSPFYIAVIYTGLGEKDQAFAWLEKASEDGSESLARLNVDPRFDSLHSDPRFADLVRRVGS